jgi:[acyl-carrier-protein] S-malonyltransferase
MRDAVAEHAPDLLAACVDLVGEDPFARVDDSTAFAQPAIFCASLASWRRVADRVRPVAFAGHSLGELSALAAAGAVDIDAALALVVTRGRLMAEAAANDPDGGMLAVLGGSPEDAERIATAHGATIANDNAPGQTVVSGTAAALAAVSTDARANGMKAMALGVAGAFHSPAMAPAADAFADALAAVDWRPPTAPVVSCRTAVPFADPARELALALTEPVRWRETVEALAPHGTLLDAGPGRVLAKLTKRIDADLVALTPKDLEPRAAAA